MKNQIPFGDPMRAINFRTQRSEQPEDLWQPLYDRQNCATTVPSSISFFSISRGQSTTLITGATAGTKTKTYRDTNMENANVVPTKLFKFVGISLAIIHSDRDGAANAQDREYVRDGGYLHFTIVDKSILYLPIVCIPDLTPQIAAATTANATTINALAGGGGVGLPMYKLPIPISLFPYENFNVTLNFDTTITLAATVDVQIVLQGLNHTALVKSSLINGENLSTIKYKATLSKQTKPVVQLQRLSEKSSFTGTSDSPYSYESMRVDKKLSTALFDKVNKVTERYETPNLKSISRI